MEPFRILSASEQVAQHLRTGIRNQRWQGSMPGAARLARELKIGKNTIEGALALLEQDGHLINRGRSRRRAIRIPESAKGSSRLRVGILQYGKGWDPLHKLFGELQRMGCEVRHAPKSLTDLKMDPQRVARSIESVEVDAWIVGSASFEVLQWFAGRSTPVMGLGGRGRKLPIALTGIETGPVRAELVRKLHELGHRRIVMLSERVRREPPGLPEQTVLDEMERLGIPTGSYHLPDWGDTPQGLRACLDSLFAITPPHALILGTPEIFFCVRDHLQQRGIRVPQDVSLVSVGSDPNFDWLEPGVARIEYSVDKMLRQCVLWVRALIRGRPNQRKSFISAKLIEGGTIGPVPER
jgi:DNA-binding LacI/PurR family transcriptional regulator